MLSEKIVSLLNDQLVAEQYSSNMYLQMSAWCEDKGLQGASKFFRSHVSEEIEHRDRIVDYMYECDASVRIGAVEAPEASYGSLLETIEAAYKHEQKVTAAIDAIAVEALETHDFNTFNFIQWFIAEQREEEDLFRTVLDEAKLVGLEATETGIAIWHLNKFLATAAPGD